MLRTALLMLVFVIMAIGCGEGPPQPVVSEVTARPPNVLLISLDALRADHLGCYGYGRNTSPFLDELADGGMRWVNAFVNTHGTAPSHTTMLTSLYQHNHGVSLRSPKPGATERIPADVLMVQEILRGHGYITIGVTGGGFLSERIDFDRGFVSFEGRRRKFSGQVSRLLQLLREHTGSVRPVFAFLHTYEIHSPYSAPKQYQGIFGQFASAFVPSSENLLAVVNSARRNLSSTDLEHIVARYDEEIRYTDDGLRELFTRLTKRGFLDNALVIITSDHGEEFGEHGGMLHRGTLYDELLNVPLIVWGSGVQRAAVVESMTSTIDITPTILAAAGIAVPPQLNGNDLLRRSGHAGPSEDEAVFSQYGRSLYSIRTRAFKLIHRPEKDLVELYDLQADPGERINVAESNREQASRLLDRLSSWRSALPGPALPPVEAELSDQERRQLEALGYVD